MGNLFKCSDYKSQYKRAPVLGQDDEYILRKLGYDDAKIAELKTRWSAKE